jgi:DNA/RNA-binding domain of Phe-tRNA-synthetase-like protein
MTTLFQYDPAILERFPTIVGGVISVDSLRNTLSSQELQRTFGDEQQATLRRVGDTPLSQIPSLAAWRSVFRRFGIDPTQYRSAAEALLRRLTKSGDIPSINTLVDLGNLISIRYALPTAVFDLRAVTGTLTVRLAGGTERFTPLGIVEVEHPELGEVIFADDTGLVSARRWCWRQSEQSAARLDTTDVLITIEAHHAEGRKDVEQAMNDMLALLPAFTGGTYKYEMLNRDQSRFALVGLADDR